MRHLANLLAFLTVFHLLACPSFAASGKNTAYKKPHPGWKTHETEHFAFYYAPDSSLAKPGAVKEYAALRERVRADVCGYLQITHRKRIHFFLYDNNKTAEKVIGRKAGFSRATDAIIHSRINQTPGHELTHVLSRAINGRPPPNRALDEGLAVFMDHSGRDYFRIGQQLLESGKLPTFGKMLTASKGKSEEWYHPAGAYVGFLCERHGVEKFKRLWGANSRGFNRAFEQIYGSTVTEMDVQWRQFLRSGAQPIQWRARGWSGKLWDKDISSDFSIQDVGKDTWRMENRYTGWNHSRVLLQTRDLRDGPVTFAIRSGGGCTVGACSARGGDENGYFTVPSAAEWQKIRLALRNGRLSAQIDGETVSVKYYGSAPDIYRPFIALKSGSSVEVRWLSAP